mmetsp:Transcript_77809/g.137222  ORF Transcript_77809/g.137222 Transcript_77809/m.137222 type:complete len:116 (+) Transcript_77809:143-490(+)|eukprot:CAMPEP_0197657642 /NCGR_PEP_ID=MMETSP1338-20131121/44753_1 /TAXON_ID=43686 ORGANISM="Pelagodinium beii, Strain RCC1491" /NCGR_SAMPLE_ID=MMETSP1338 /ASSEMBLY_ACC=CAM_ASM_000754 /LENGTH=115 /DNA_ID=CAMNT_0043234059 /DNA_START=143 /DNA_END=490 /DNA_ORIENTATION=-
MAVITGHDKEVEACATDALATILISLCLVCTLRDLVLLHLPSHPEEAHEAKGKGKSPEACFYNCGHHPINYNGCGIGRSPNIAKAKDPIDATHRKHTEYEVDDAQGELGRLEILH